MRPPWTPEQLRLVDAARELKITTWRPDGTLRRWLPIWVVRVDDQVYVRTWYRRTTGWFGHAVGTGRARVRIPGLEADVVIDDIGADDAGLRSAVDGAYRAKYVGRGDGSTAGMTTDAAAAATLRLSRSQATSRGSLG